MLQAACWYRGLVSSELPAWVVSGAESARDKARESRGRDLAQRLADSESVCQTVIEMLALNPNRERVLSWVEPLPASTVRALARLRREAARPWPSG